MNHTEKPRRYRQPDSHRIDRINLREVLECCETQGQRIDREIAAMEKAIRNLPTGRK